MNDLKKLLNLFVHGVVAFVAVHVPADIADVNTDVSVALAAGASGLVLVLRAAADMLEKRDKS